MAYKDKGSIGPRCQMVMAIFPDILRVESKKIIVRFNGIFTS